MENTRKENAQKDGYYFRLYGSLQDEDFEVVQLKNNGEIEGTETELYLTDEQTQILADALREIWRLRFANEVTEEDQARPMDGEPQTEEDARELERWRKIDRTRRAEAEAMFNTSVVELKQDGDATLIENRNTGRIYHLVSDSAESWQLMRLREQDEAND